MKKYILLIVCISALNCMAKPSIQYFKWITCQPITSGKIFGLYYLAKNNIDDEFKRALSNDYKIDEYLLKYDTVIVDSLNKYYDENNIGNDYSTRRNHYEKFKEASDALLDSYISDRKALEIKILIERARKGKRLCVEELSALLDQQEENLQKYLKIAGYKKIPKTSNGYYIYSRVDKKNIKVYITSNSIEYDWGLKHEFNTNDLQTAFQRAKIKREFMQSQRR